ncbi:protocadherin-16-like [Penaeus monodon]|uniref:protocadherin-16-like n=1 Tax=Penaeus monodon TaxID=6687 RepID=UPI0018A7032F|nr:protocadherin-16-like [Penaeus monodon]
MLVIFCNILQERKLSSLEDIKARPASARGYITAGIYWCSACYSSQGLEGRSCEWGAGQELRRFVRVREDAALGDTVLTLNVTQPELLTMQPLAAESVRMFRVEAVDSGGGGGGGRRGGRAMGAARVVVAAPLQPLLQAASPVTKLALTCGNNQVSVQVTVYVEDVNDHAPAFAVKNITVTVDELTPVGLTILPEIRVTDGDKANTANSEVTLELREGDPEGHFTMADRKRGTITLAKPLDYDAGPDTFLLGVVAKRDQSTDPAPASNQPTFPPSP